MTDYLKFKADLSDPAIATAFDDFTYWSSMFGQLLFRHLPISTPITALDVGCATGFPLLELADRLGPSSFVYGIDSWESAVERAQMKASVRGQHHVELTLADASSMPYENDSFDLIVSNLGVNNFDNPELVMAECYRVCKPGGRLALTSNLVGHMSEFYVVFATTLAATGNEDLVDNLRRHIEHRATGDGLHELFSGAGFEITSYQTETFSLRYADGSAFLRAYLSRLGFLDGWRSVLIEPVDEIGFFSELESRLNQLSRRNGELLLTIPAAYIEGQKAA
ncbi:MAG: methyltransferase domain-containing protein [Planctomycetota bacterium]